VPCLIPRPGLPHGAGTCRQRFCAERASRRQASVPQPHLPGFSSSSTKVNTPLNGANSWPGPPSASTAAGTAPGSNSAALGGEAAAAARALVAAACCAATTRAPLQTSPAKLPSCAGSGEAGRPSKFTRVGAVAVGLRMGVRGSALPHWMRGCRANQQQGTLRCW
jgi:hypothetical protein